MISKNLVDHVEAFFNFHEKLLEKVVDYVGTLPVFNNLPFLNENAPKDGVEHDSYLSLESNTEQDAEYIEKYASLPRTILKDKPKPAPRMQNGFHKEEEHSETDNSTMVLRNNENNKITENQEIETNGVNGDVTDENNPTFIGSYSLKEKEKWKHPVEMKNNPYSPENIERRLSNGSKTEPKMTTLKDALEADIAKQGIVRFGRDFYIREAKKSAGSRKTPKDEVDIFSKFEIANNIEENTKKDKELLTKKITKTQKENIPQQKNNDEESKTDLPKEPKLEEITPSLTKTPPPRQTKETSPPLPKTPPPRKIESSPPLPKTPPPLHILAEKEIYLNDTSTPNADSIHYVTAFPAIVTEEQDMPSSLEEKSNALDVSSDSDLSIERSYNLVTGKVMVRVGDNKKEIVKTSRSPEGIKYEYIVEKYDENHNENVPYENKSPNTPPSTPIARHFILTDNLKSYEEQTQDMLLSNETYSSGGHLVNKEDDSRSLDSSFDEEISVLQEKKLVKRHLENFTKKSAKNDVPQPTKKNKNISKYFGIKDNTASETTEEKPVYKVEKTIELVNVEKPVEIITIENTVEVFTISEQPVDIDETLHENVIENVSLVSSSVSNENIDELPLPSVKDLKQLFDKASPENKVPISSLTARSIPKQVRQELKTQEQQENSENDVLLNTAEESVINEEVEPKIVEEVEEEQFETAKSKIAFFEQLRTK